MFGSIEWRSIGPHRGGRVVAVAGDPIDRQVFYFGACNGGVWKTSDGGNYWENCSDGYFRSAAVGALAIAPSDTNVIYAGMGEACIRNDVSSGDGVYRSTDKGATWAHVGLAESRHIGRIRVDPRDSRVVYVAALGNIWRPSEERGVFKSIDGGDTWRRILFVSPTAGAVDLSMDITNPRILYAAVWEASRSPWMLSSGGSHSGLHRSLDGGESWTEISLNPGFPSGPRGRIGVALSPTSPQRIWVMVEAEAGGLCRSDDAGATWQSVNNTTGRGRPWYFTHVFADPGSSDTVWVMDRELYRSLDGGQSFSRVPTPRGDQHDLWIDPSDPNRMIEGNDGGATVSFTGGRSWSTVYNQPTGGFYRIAVDDQYPFRVYGTQQDSTGISVPSKTSKGNIPLGDCYMLGTSESGYIAVRQDAPSIVYSGAVGSGAGGGGALHRSDHDAGDHFELITPWPEDDTGRAPADERFRFNWTFPILISPHDPRTLYASGNVVFRSRNEGRSWDVISPDLTRNDRSKQQISGGPVTVQGVTGAETFCTITAFAESPVEPGVLWSGSDDGLIHVSLDHGETWTNVTPQGLPEWTTFATIEASSLRRGTAFAAGHRYKLDDYAPYLYQTHDYGQTWVQIGDGLPQSGFTRVIREDPQSPGTLYAGTEGGVFVTIDAGAHWRSLQANLPIVPIYDLAVKGDALVAATHGRSIWILDDLSPVRYLREPDLSEPRLITPSLTHQDLRSHGYPSYAEPLAKTYQMGVTGTCFYEKTRPDGSVERTHLDAGDNPPRGVKVFYTVPAECNEVLLTFSDVARNDIRSFSSLASSGPRVPARPGLNRFMWDMRRRGVTQQIGGGPPPLFGVPLGPEVVPGRYLVRLKVDGRSQEQSFEIAKDPRSRATQSDIEDRFTLLLAIQEKLQELSDALGAIRQLRDQLEAAAGRARGTHVDIAKLAGEHAGTLSEIEGAITQTRLRTRADWAKHPTMLYEKFVSLVSVVESFAGRPTQQAHEVAGLLSAQADAHLLRLRGLIDNDIGSFNRLASEARFPSVAV